MDINLNEYPKDIMPTTQTVTTMDFGPFVSDYSFGCKNDETKPDRKGEKTRMVLEALKGMEITSARKMQKVLEERGIEARRRGRKRRDTISLIKDYCIHNYLSFDNLSSKDVEMIGQALGIKAKTVRNYLCSEKSYADKYPKNNNNTTSTTYIVDKTGIFGQDVRIENAIIDSLTRGITIKDISISLGLTERTIKRHIKKAKEAGLLRNEGTRKFPKWVMTSENVLPESLDNISKETEITKEEIKKNN